MTEPETKGPYEARVCKDMPTDCCDYGVVSLSEGREVCRVWREQDARAIAAALSDPSPNAPAAPAAVDCPADRGEWCPDPACNPKCQRGDWVMMPRTLSDEIRFATWYAQYKHGGGTDEQATRLATEKVNDLIQKAQDTAAYAATLAAASAPAPVSIAEERVTQETPSPVYAEMQRIRRLFEESDGDKEDLITYAKEVVEIRARKP